MSGRSHLHRACSPHINPARLDLTARPTESSCTADYHTHPLPPHPLVSSLLSRALTHIPQPLLLGTMADFSHLAHINASLRGEEESVDGFGDTFEDGGGDPSPTPGSANTDDPSEATAMAGSANEVAEPSAKPTKSKSKPTRKEKKEEKQKQKIKALESTLKAEKKLTSSLKPQVRKLEAKAITDAKKIAKLEATVAALELSAKKAKQTKSSKSKDGLGHLYSTSSDSTTPTALQYGAALQAGASAAVVGPVNELVQTRNAIQSLDGVLANNTFPKKYPFFKTRLEHNRQRQSDMVLAVEIEMKDKVALATTVSEQQTAKIAVKGKECTKRYHAVVTELHSQEPEAFARLAQAAYNVNAKSEAPPSNAICTMLRHIDPDAEPVQVMVCSAPDPQTGLIAIKLWTVSGNLNKPYSEGYTEPEFAHRGELSGGVAALRQEVPASAETQVERMHAARNSSANAQGAVTAAIQQLADRFNLELSDGGLKSLESASRKMFDDYGGDPAKVLDFLRFTIKCLRVAQQADVAEQVDSDPTLEMLRFKNRMDIRCFSQNGYRDVLINVRHVPTGVIFELQIAVVRLLDLKLEAHDVYAIDRTSALASGYIGDANAEAIRRVCIGAIRTFDVSGTLVASDTLSSLTAALATATCRLAELKMSTCPGMEGADLGQQILTPEVCKALGSGIRVIELASIGVGGPVAPVLAALAAGGCGSSLKTLKLSGNKLNGRLNGSEDHGGGEAGGGWAAFTTLKFLTLGNNELEGPVPKSISKLTSLTDLSLNNNQLSGELPGELSQLKKLKGMYLHRCKFEGSIPPSWGGAFEKLELMALYENQLSGELPDELCKMQKLKRLRLKSNKFTGSIPTSWGALQDLEVLSLECNQLSGALPAELGKLVNLTKLLLHSNELTGSIPMNLATNLPKLKQFKVVEGNTFDNTVAFETAIKKALPELAENCDRGNARYF